MKKTILFSLISLIVVGLGVSFFAGHLASQEPRAAIDSQKARNERKIQLAQQLVPGITEDTEEYLGPGGAQSLSQLRDQIQTLNRLRINPMNEKELKREIADLQKELGEHEAKTKLQQAEKLLQEILKTYPKSRAAEEARKMLGHRLGRDASEVDSDAIPVEAR